jgi:hypothetical protein
MDWATRRSRFDPWHRWKDFSSSLCVQTSPGAHTASCTMGTEGPFLGAKAQPGRDADHSPHLVPRSIMSRSYPPPPSAFMALAFIYTVLSHRPNKLHFVATQETFNTLIWNWWWTFQLIRDLPKKHYICFHIILFHWCTVIQTKINYLHLKINHSTAILLQSSSRKAPFITTSSGF